MTGRGFFIMYSLQHAMHEVVVNVVAMAVNTVIRTGYFLKKLTFGIRQKLTCSPTKVYFFLERLTGLRTEGLVSWSVGQFISHASSIPFPTSPY